MVCGRDFKIDTSEKCSFLTPCQKQALELLWAGRKIPSLERAVVVFNWHSATHLRVLQVETHLV